MRLEEYPRPPADTGLGIHWSPGITGAVPLETIRTRWLPELQAMNIRWVKMLHDGAEGFAELLLANGIMPIVRLYRPQPNPGRLPTELQNRMRRFVALGVRYFEVNNEPNLRVEWQPGGWEAAGNRLPELVMEDWIADAEFVLANGGLPAWPAPTPGGHWDDIDYTRRAFAFLAERGRHDLFQAGGWIAVHNYFLNHPADYPYDPVNQAGTPATAAEAAAHPFPVPLDEVNRQRRQGYHPGADLAHDSNCFLKYRRYRDLFVAAFGFEVPILTTEGGAAFRSAEDPRYPVIDAELHALRNRFAFAHMADAPDYYFCNCPWLIANFLLSSSDPAWEDQTWYSERWAGGQQPVVAAIKAQAPWPVRWPRQPAPTQLTVRVTDGAGQPAVVRRLPAGDFVAEATLDNAGLATFPLYAAGAYRVEIAGTPAQAEIAIGPGSAVVNLAVAPQLSQIEGRVINGAGGRVQLFIAGEGSGQGSWRRLAEMSADESGAFRFGGLGAGLYRVGLADEPEIVADVPPLDGRNMVRVRLLRPLFAWNATITNSSGTSPTPFRRSRLVIIVPGEIGRTIRVQAPWAILNTTVGSKPEIDPAAALIDNLPSATYTIEVVGLPPRPEITLDGVGEARVRFERIQVPFAASELFGNIGRAAVLLSLHRVDGDQETVIATTLSAASGEWRFEALAAGRYRVTVAELELSSDILELDGVVMREVHLGPGSEPTPPLATYCLLIPEVMDAESLLLLAWPLIQQRGWSFGFAPELAAQAGTVITIGLRHAPPPAITGADAFELARAIAAALAEEPL